MIRPIRQFISDHKLKGFIVLAALLGVGAYSVHLAQAHYDGFYILGGKDYQNGCSLGPGGGCHNLFNSANTTVTISPPIGPIYAGKTYTFQIEVLNTNHNMVAAGCDIGLDQGTGALLDTVPQSGSGLIYESFTNELTHSMPRSFGSGDSAVWQFQYTAPTQPGQYIIYAAGNAVNGDSAQGKNGGNAYNADTDQWNFGTDTINVVAPNSVSNEGVEKSDIQVFPNPSNGIVTLSSSNENGLAEVKISDEAGKAVGTRSVDIGSNTPLDLSSLTNGTYFLHIKTSDGQSFLRRVAIKK